MTSSETDLAAQVVEWLEVEGWDIYQEVVSYSRRHDIVAVRDPIVWVIECKSSLSLSVLEQAWMAHTHRRSVAVPVAKRSNKARRFAYMVAKHLRVGILEVSRGGIREVVEAPINREYHKSAKVLRDKLTPGMKTFLAAGSSGGGFWTPYRDTMNRVKTFIEKNPGSTVSEIMESVSTHYQTTASTRSGIIRVLRFFEEWCRVEEGRPIRFYVKEEER